MNTPSLFQQHYNLNNNNRIKVNQRIDDLTSDHSKLLAIRLDFGIKQEFSNQVTHQYMVAAFDRLRNNLRHNTLFEHYITYIAKLEYGLDKSWHYHVVFFFNGNSVNHDLWLSQQLGEYWTNTITKGIGLYYSANMNRQNYDAYGMGMIDYWDTAKINILKQATCYLTKIDENIINNDWKDASGRTIRTFRTGQYVRKQASIGRPRLYQVGCSI